MQQIMGTACGCKAKTVLAICILDTQVFGAGDKSSIIQLLRTLCWIFKIKMGTVVGRTTQTGFSVGDTLSTFLVMVVNFSIIELWGETLLSARQRTPLRLMDSFADLKSL